MKYINIFHCNLFLIPSHIQICKVTVDLLHAHIQSQRGQISMLGKVANKHTCGDKGLQAYLEGQRKFRWNIKIKMDSVEKASQSYKAGIIPQENVQLERHQYFPADVKVQDVGKCERALKHVKETFLAVKNIKEQLVNREKDLVDEDMSPRDCMEQIDKIINTVDGIVNN